MEQVYYRQDTQEALAFSRCQNRAYEEHKRNQTRYQSFDRPHGKKEVKSFYGSEREKRTSLKKILKKIKVKRLVFLFYSKLKRTIVRDIEKDLTIEDTKSQNQIIRQFFKNRQGITLSGIQTTILCLISILSTSFLVITSSLNLAFEESELVGIELQASQSLALLSFVVQICLNFVTKRYQQGRALVFIQQISINYIRSHFITDFLNVIVIILQLSETSPSSHTKILRWVILLKIPELFDKLQTLENLYITTFTRQQYCGLFFVFLTNFTLAHFLSILLNLMASFSDQQNWLTVKNISNSSWKERYVWGYYWGTTMMLTVGFGDIAATNCHQAICLIFIEMVSCIILAYNINCVGNLIGDLRRQSKEKSNNLKTFQLMAKSNQISLELQNKINNYIQESFLIKSQFNFQQQNALLTSLPHDLNKDYLQQVNGKQLCHLPFFKDLTKKSQFLLAQHIIRKITHPEEIIISRGDVQKLLIIQKGVLGLVFGTKKKLNAIQVLSVKKDEASKLLSLGMIRSNRADYTVKSLTYSVLHILQNDSFSKILREDKMSYEYYCMMRDMPYTDINQDEIIPCENCPGLKHIKSKCPKFHYLPIREIVILKNLKFQNEAIQPRKKIRRITKKDLMEERQLKVTQSISEDKQFNMKYTEDDTGAQQTFDRPPTRLNTQFKSTKQLPHSLSQIWKQYTQHMQLSQADFWTIEADLMYNWKYYFPNSNPAQLKNSRLFGSITMKISRKNRALSFK